MRALLAALSAIVPAPALACRLALILALDVSGSVDAGEYGLQMDGLAAALVDPEVQAAALAMPDAAVQLSVFEWSGSTYQRQILDWTPLLGPEDFAKIASRLRGWSRGPAPEATGLGAAMRASAGQLRSGPACWRRVLDVSGDGKNNDWPSPRQVRRAGAMAGVTVNALVIGSAPLRDVSRDAGIAELVAYFQTEVLAGPDAFLEVATSYDDYARAMKRKLLRELQVVVIGAAQGR